MIRTALRRRAAGAGGWGTLLLLIGACSAAPGPEPSAYYPLRVPWDDAAPSVFDMSGRVHDAPAGHRGCVRAAGDRLVFSDGAPLRLWGVAITPFDDFPPASREQARALVAKLAKYGFNHVRLERIDGNRVGLYEHWLREGNVEHPWMARLDQFIALLREAGIYYTLGLNHQSAKFEGRTTLPAADYPRHKRYNAVQTIDPQILDDTLRWHAAVLSHENPHTGHTYASDPAHAFLSLIGEDSIFNGYFRRWDSLRPAHVEELTTRFNDWLAQRYATRDALRQAWRSAGKRGLGAAEDPASGSVRIVPPKQLDELSPARARDLMRFLSDLDRTHLQKLTSTVRALGFCGVLTGTDNWYGLTSLWLNRQVGDFVETHGYLDHPERVEVGPKRRGDEIANDDYLAAGLIRPGARRTVFHRNLFRWFSSSLRDTPVIVAEWNHAGWSDYTYQGPLLVTAYASLQGYRGLDIHTLLSFGSGITDELSTRAFGLHGNPVHWALSPTLALAFVRGDIAEPAEPLIIPAAQDFDALLDLTARQGLELSLGDGTLPLSTGFEHKVRIDLLGAGASRPRAPAVSPGEYRSVTGELHWRWAQPDRATFTVDAPRFQAAAGQVQHAPVRLGAVEIELDGQGLVSAIALDDQPLARSGSVLVTVVSSFENTGARLEPGTNGKGKRVVDPGRAPPLLRRLTGRLRLLSELGGPVEAHAVAFSGELTPLAVDEQVRKTSGSPRRALGIELGREDTPWYWLRVSGPAGSAGPGELR